MAGNSCCMVRSLSSRRGEASRELLYPVAYFTASDWHDTARSQNVSEQNGTSGHITEVGSYNIPLFYNDERKADALSTADGNTHVCSCLLTRLTTDGEVIRLQRHAAAAESSSTVALSLGVISNQARQSDGISVTNAVTSSARQLSDCLSVRRTTTMDGTTVVFRSVQNVFSLRK